MQPADLANHLSTVASMCRDADPTEWTADERDDVLRGLTTVAYEIPSLAARIRAAKVNDTKVPHPVKPGPKPVDKPSDAPPKEPPPPPTKDVAGQRSKTTTPPPYASNDEGRGHDQTRGYS